MKKLKLKANSTLKTDQQGLIPLLLAVLAVVVGIIIFAYMRVSNAQ